MLHVWGDRVLEHLRFGDVVRLRKIHPCGFSEWEVIRIGADIKLRCLGCDRRIMLSRSILGKKAKAIIPRGTLV